MRSMARARAATVASLLRVGLSIVGAMAGCGDDAPATPDAGTVPDARTLPPLDSGPEPDAGPCPPGFICLAVRPMGSGTPMAGRLGVIWFQIDDSGTDPAPQIGFDGAFDPTAGQVNIPLLAVDTPSDAVLLCSRACPDEESCPCMSEPRIGVALVVVLQDANANGAIDVSEIQTTGIVGIGWLAVAYSTLAYMPAPSPFGGLFVDGIQMGKLPYTLIEDGAVQHLGIVPTDTIFDLNVCVEGAPCDAPPPSIM